MRRDWRLDITDNYINGNISDFKAQVRKLKKSAILPHFEELAEALVATGQYERDEAIQKAFDAVQSALA